MAIFKPNKIKRTETPVLLHPPLLEAIFEIRWELEQNGETGRVRDPSYPILVGRLYERLKKDFPIVEDLPSVQAHPETTPFVPRHRLKKEKEGYPLIQIGPGILTFNDSKGYSWESFRNLIVRLIESLSDLGSRFNFVKCELRYVNGVRFDLARENPLSFLEEKLHVKIGLDEEFFGKNRISERPNTVGLNFAYASEKPMGNLAISFNLGQFDGAPAFIQQTVIQSVGELVPSDQEGFQHWLEEAHESAENCFQLFYKGFLMEQFGGT